ncbi:hypothetical protein CFIMG_002928RA [Ceratocystis fimbriata CBS 114723]|uniref:Uncharacterized protein n=1 Tax=Ceratocystis fimbriata CBS 114723 TaxID=1035309 RepID=A0A2C5XFA5_9PEZI|nr:hypothetical protein CFIMG_002928RA [Ceratocystis fimbriata CBS 114723]
MLPPIDESVLEKNPNFKALYTTLTTAVLNGDGTAAARRGATEHQKVVDELDHHRLKEARRHLLTDAIATTAPQEEPRKPQSRSIPSSTRREPASELSTSQPLPDDVLDLLLLLPPLITSPEPLSSEATSLLLSSPPLVNLDSLLPQCAPLVSANLQASALGLSRVAHPGTNPSYLHRNIANLPATVASLQTSLDKQKSDLAKARLAAQAEVVNILERRTQALTQLVRALEAKHGAVARSAEHSAAELALQAQIAEAEASLSLHRVRKDIYSTEVCSALRNYGRHLQDARLRLEEALRTRKMELAEYGVGVEGQEGKERFMREAAKTYREMSRQMEDIEGDLERLRK